LTVALTLAVMVTLLVAIEHVGHSLITAERARITSQVSVLAAVYGGEPATRESAQLNDATVCNFLEPNAQHPYFAVCVDVDGTQRLAYAVDTWSNSMPTLEP
jgi:hypothetical protein